MPSFIRIAFKHNLLDRPNERKSHVSPTPTVGGLSIFIGFMMVVLMMSFILSSWILGLILLSLSIMLLVGLRDDLDPMRPIEKLLGQIIAVSILIFFADIRLTQWYGVFGWEEMSYSASVWVSLLVYIFLINSFNLIDGIDGLCASLSTMVILILGMWLHLLGDVHFSILAFAVAGGTIAFLRYNITPSRLFMGDTGSLVLGSVCTILAIHTVELNHSLHSSPHALTAGSTIIISLLSLPIFDTLRVFVIRIASGRSPLEPDRNHIHHLLIKVGMSHMQATAFLLLITSGFVFLALEMGSGNLISYLAVYIAIASFLTLILKQVIDIKGKLARTN